MFGYVKEKSTNNIIAYWDLDSKPENTDVHEYIECLENEKPDLYKGDDPVFFDASAFKKACTSDQSLASVMMKAPAALIDAINASNWEVVKAGTNYMILNGLATQDDYVSFNTILQDHGGPDLENL